MYTHTDTWYTPVLNWLSVCAVSCVYWRVCFAKKKLMSNTESSEHSVPEHTKNPIYKKRTHQALRSIYAPPRRYILGKICASIMFYVCVHNDNNDVLCTMYICTAICTHKEDFDEQCVQLYLLYDCVFVYS